MKNILLITLFFLYTAHINAQYIWAEKVNTNSAIENNGMFYALPNTELLVKFSLEEKVIAQRKIQADPEKIFSSEVFNSIPLPNFEPLRTVKITNISLGTQAVPDPNAIYSINFKRKWNKKNTIGLEVSENGLIKGADITSEDKTFEIVSSVISSISKTILTFKSTYEYVGDEFINYMQNNRIYDSEKHGVLLFNTLQSDHINTLTARDSLEFPIATKLKKLLTQKRVTDSLLKVYTQKERELLNEIALNAVVTTDLKVKQYQLSVLASLIKNYKKERVTYATQFIKTLESFLGKKLKANQIEYTHTIAIHKATQFYHYLLPEVVNNEINISSKTAEEYKNNSNIVRIFLIPTQNHFGDDFFEQLSTNSSREQQGLAYKIPMHYTATLETNIKYYGDYSFFAAGAVAFLPKKLNTANLVYYEKLGYIQNIKATTQAINSEDISKAGDLVQSTIEDLQGKSEAEKLQEEVELLELRLKKITTEKSIQDAQTID